VTKISINIDTEMSESRFRGRISQERMTEGWKRERNSTQKTTERTAVIKINLGGEKKMREGEVQGIWQRGEVGGLRRVARVTQLDQDPYLAPRRPSLPEAIP
jgi:hypothetical protein